MAELDFSKIFGETATSKAEFTDENYLKGWGYLGSTPPPYQLFDYLQSQNDKKAKFLYDKVMSYDGRYVPLSGGTMTGNLAINSGTEISSIELNNATNGKLSLESMAQNSDSVGHLIYKNGSDTQAKLNIPKKTGTLATLADVPAPVDLNAHNADTNAHKPITDMIRQIIGSGSWQQAPGKSIAEIVPLLGLGGIVAQRLDQNGYVKFANGLTIQWGNYTESRNENDVRTFPIAFNTTCLCCIAVANFNKSDPILSRFPNRLYWAAPFNNIQFICGMESDFNAGVVSGYFPVKVISIGW